MKASKVQTIRIQTLLDATIPFPNIVCEDGETFLIYIHNLNHGVEQVSKETRTTVHQQYQTSITQNSWNKSVHIEIDNGKLFDADSATLCTVKNIVENVMKIEDNFYDRVEAMNTKLMEDLQ